MLWTFFFGFNVSERYINHRRCIRITICPTTLNGFRLVVGNGGDFWTTATPRSPFLKKYRLTHFLDLSIDLS